MASLAIPNADDPAARSTAAAPEPVVHVSRVRMPRGAGVSRRSEPSRGRASDTTRPGKRKRVRLAPGFSQMDWIRLNSRVKDMNGLGGKPPAPVPRSELAKHRGQYDCWIALRGKVYNITKYLPYHPGGVPELMRVAGRDGTKEFEKIHKWVSIGGFLSKCYVGDLVEESETDKCGDANNMESSATPASTAGNKSSADNPAMSWGDLDDML